MASAREYELTGRFTSAVSPDRLITVTVALVIAFRIVYLISRNSAGSLLSVAAAVIGTVALFPYVYNIYPIPHHNSYYAEVAHEMWLPAEELALKSGQVFTGYVLTSDDDWFTVLLATKRTIVYLPTEQLVSRTVCQPKVANEPNQYPPLDRALYNPPPRIPTCAIDVSTPITSILSEGQSLSKISSITHVHPWRIISITNAHEHELLSPTLRFYESVHNWNAPTPVGQRFWYQCPSTLRQGCAGP